MKNARNRPAGAKAAVNATRGSARDREIVPAKVIVTSRGRNFVTLKIQSRAGVTGVGDAALNGRELAVAACLQDHLKLAARFPYTSKQLPSARLEDNSMRDW